MFGGSSSDYSRARGNQIVMHSSVNETVLGGNRKLGRPAEHFIDGNQKRICRSISKVSSSHVIEKRSRHNNSDLVFQTRTICAK